jgi:hypothetical protein
MAMQLDIVVSFDDRGSHIIYLDVPESDFVAVAKRITSEGFLVSAPNPAGAHSISIRSGSSNASRP